MVARQSVEQCQHRPHRSSDTRSKAKTKALGVTATPLPEHDLDPPRFARKALEQIMQDWRAVRAMVMDGCKPVDQTRYTKTTCSSSNVVGIASIIRAMVMDGCKPVDQTRYNKDLHIVP